MRAHEHVQWYKFTMDGLLALANNVLGEQFEEQNLDADEWENLLRPIPYNKVGDMPKVMCDEERPRKKQCNVRWSDEQNSNEQNSDEQNSNEQNSDEPNGDEQNSDEPNGDEQNSDEPNGDEQNRDEPKSPLCTSGIACTSCGN